MQQDAAFESPVFGLYCRIDFIRKENAAFTSCWTMLLQALPSNDICAKPKSAQSRETCCDWINTLLGMASEILLVYPIKGGCLLGRRHKSSDLDEFENPVRSLAGFQMR